jgi:hypothetical protein
MFDPSKREAISGMDPLARLCGALITEARAETSGRIYLGFSTGSSLTVEPDEEYEAWTLTSPSGVLVSLPGGGLG